MEQEIEALEARLRAAMLASDVAALDALLAPDATFTNHLGGIVGKAEDLDAHRSGALRIEALTLSELRVRRLGEAAVVTVRTAVSGTYAGQAAGGDFRFTRVWAPAPTGGWWIVAAHATLVALPF